MQDIRIRAHRVQVYGRDPYWEWVVYSLDGCHELTCTPFFGPEPIAWSLAAVFARDLGSRDEGVAAALRVGVVGDKALSI